MGSTGGAVVGVDLGKTHLGKLRKIKREMRCQVWGESYGVVEVTKNVSFLFLESRLFSEAP
jgi:hypothetical protein